MPTQALPPPPPPPPLPPGLFSRGMTSVTSTHSGGGACRAATKSSTTDSEVGGDAGAFDVEVGGRTYVVNELKHREERQSLHLRHKIRLEAHPLASTNDVCNNPFASHPFTHSQHQPPTLTILTHPLNHSQHHPPTSQPLFTYPPTPLQDPLQGSPEPGATLRALARCAQKARCPCGASFGAQ